MWFHNKNIYQKISAGFSLTELAIVLSVGAIILGAIWAIASHTWENSRQQALKTDITIVVGNVRAASVGVSGISGTFASLTSQLTKLSPSPIPGDMTRTNGTGGCILVPACVDHPWGALTATTSQNGSFGVCAWDPTALSCVGSTMQLFAVELDAMPSTSCINAVLNNSGADAPVGLYDVVINGTSIINGAGTTHQLPVKLSDAKTLCTSVATGATVDFVYRAVMPQS